jgi:hypothetical protein
LILLNYLLVRLNKPCPKTSRNSAGFGQSG